MFVDHLLLAGFLLVMRLVLVFFIIVDVVADVVVSVAVNVCTGGAVVTVLGLVLVVVRGGM